MDQKFRDWHFHKKCLREMCMEHKMSSLAQWQSLRWLLPASSHNPSGNNRPFLNSSTPSHNSLWQEPTPYLFKIFFNLSRHPAKPGAICLPACCEDNRTTGSWSYWLKESTILCSCSSLRVELLIASLLSWPKTLALNKLIHENCRPRWIMKQQELL